MAEANKLAFAPFAAPRKGVLVLFCDEGLKFGPASRKALAPTRDLVTRAAAAERFTGKNGSTLDMAMPAGLDAARLVVLGLGKTADLKPRDFVRFGGVAMGKVPASAFKSVASAVREAVASGTDPEDAASLALAGSP